MSIIYVMSNRQVWKNGIRANVRTEKHVDFNRQAVYITYNILVYRVTGRKLHLHYEEQKLLLFIKSLMFVLKSMKAEFISVEKW